MKLVLLTLGWILFFCLHSVLAHNKVKNFAKQNFESFYPYYRLSYNFINLSFFLFLLFFQFSLPKNFFIKTSLPLQVFGGLVLFLGSIILYKAFSAFNKKEFIGLEHMNQSKENKIIEKQVLIKTGLYAYVRHPLYFGLILLLLGALLLMPNLPTLCFIACCFLYLPLGVWLEEQKLVEEFGPDYVQYQQEVKMLVPYIF